MTSKPDLRQWLPIYGLYQIGKDENAGKPTILDDRKTTFDKRLDNIVSNEEYLAYVKTHSEFDKVDWRRETTGFYHAFTGVIMPIVGVIYGLTELVK